MLEELIAIHPAILPALSLAILVVVSVIADFIVKRVLLRIATRIAATNSLKWDDVLVSHNVFGRIAQAVAFTKVQYDQLVQSQGRAAAAAAAIAAGGSPRSPGSSIIRLPNGQEVFGPNEPLFPGLSGRVETHTIYSNLGIG